MSDPGRRTTGATAGGGARPRRPWWLLLVLAVLVLAALLFALSRCGQGAGTDPGPATGAAPSPGPTPTLSAAPSAALTAAPSAVPAPAAPPAASAASPAPGAGPAGDAGSLTTGGAALLPLAQAVDADGSLATRAGQQVTGDGVLVESVPADEGFWVGISVTDRIWVQIEGAGESPYRVRPGDRVSFTGQLVANPEGFASQSGVDAAEGAEQLDRQAAHITVPQADLRLMAR